MPRRRRLSATHQTYQSNTLQHRHSPKVTDAYESQDCQVSSTTTSLVQEIQNFPLVTTLQIQQNDPELDADKKSITSHPLYPLLAKLLQQCELASVRPDSPPSPDSFDDELRAYVQRRLEPEGTDSTKPNKGKDMKDYYPAHFDTAYGSSRVTRNSNSGRFKHSGCESGPKRTSRPQSTDCREYSTEKTREFDKSVDMVDTNYSRDSGAQDSRLFDDSKKLKVFVDDGEVDELIVKAVQVLRIHLLELHKVNELCKDFCSRYIHSLKTKFQSDPMIQDSQPSSPGGSDELSPGPTGCYPSRCFHPGLAGTAAVAATPFIRHSHGELLSSEYAHQSITSLQEEQFRAAAAAAVATTLTDCSSSSRIGYPHSNSLMNGHDVSYTHGSDGSGVCYTPNCHAMADYSLSQIGPRDDEEQFDSFGQLHPFFSQYGVVAANSAVLHARLDSLCVGAKQKRGVLPKRATQIMKQWLFQHLVHPYPTEDEKRLIANQTNLTLLQVNNWFINARRRILQPMLDASNFIPLGNNYCGTNAASSGGLEGHVDGLGTTSGDSVNPADIHIISKKKKAATSRPSNNRFWPASLAAAAAIHPVAAGLVSSAGTTAASGSTISYNGNHVTHHRVVGSSGAVQEDGWKNDNTGASAIIGPRSVASDGVATSLATSKTSTQTRRDPTCSPVDGRQDSTKTAGNLNCWDYGPPSTAYAVGNEYNTTVTGAKTSNFCVPTAQTQYVSAQQHESSKHTPSAMGFTASINIQSDKPESPDTEQNMRYLSGKSLATTSLGEKGLGKYDSQVFGGQQEVQHSQRPQQFSRPTAHLQTCSVTRVPLQCSPPYEGYLDTKSPDRYVPNIKHTMSASRQVDSQAQESDTHTFSALPRLHPAPKPDSTAATLKPSQPATNVLEDITGRLEKIDREGELRRDHPSDYSGGKIRAVDGSLLYHISDLAFQHPTTDCIPNNTYGFPSKMGQFYPPNYSSVLLNQAQQYSSYLASGVGPPCSLSTSGDIHIPLTCATFPNASSYSTETSSSCPFPNIPQLSHLYSSPFPAASLFSPPAVRPNHVNSFFSGLTDHNPMTKSPISGSDCQKPVMYTLPSFGSEKTLSRLPCPSASAGISDVHSDTVLSSQPMQTEATPCNFSSSSRSTRESFDQSNSNSDAHCMHPVKDSRLHSQFRPPRPIYPSLCYYPKYIPTIPGPHGMYSIPTPYFPAHHSMPP